MSVTMPGENELIRAKQQFAEGLKGILEVMGSSLPSTIVGVYPGSTLWQIAENQFGDGQRWREIYAMNLDVIVKGQEQHGASSGPNLIYPGTELRVLLI